MDATILDPEIEGAKNEAGKVKIEDREWHYSISFQR